MRSRIEYPLFWALAEDVEWNGSVDYGMNSYISIQAAQRPRMGQVSQS
jgi:hypothetical protein